MSGTRRFAAGLTLAALLLGSAPAFAADTVAATPPKVLRYAFPIAETGFDPARVSDLYSRIVTTHIFESLYTFDYLARPARIKPLIAQGMPQVSSDFRTWTVHLKPGIYFADDPAFKGRKREVVAQDFVYAFKRFLDPASKSPTVALLEEVNMLGLNDLRKRANSKTPFDYEHDIEGLRALDRYTLQFKLQDPRPRLLEMLAVDLYGAVAREVVEAYGDKIPEHPVGTGPFRLAQWRRSSLIALERNPGYRERLFDAEPAADDTEGQVLLAKFKGRRLPMVDRVEVSIIEESQPRWLSFLNGQGDFLERVPSEFINMAMPGGQVAPNLAKRGMQGYRHIGAEAAYTFFNMEHPIVGGYTPDKVALRRAIGLAIDVQREINLVRRGQAIAAQAFVLPHTSGYDANFRSENGEYNPAKAKALLDMYGYVDRDGDGWRDMPSGDPLVLEIATQPDALSRQFDELWRKNMEAVGIKVTFFPGKWPEQFKAARAGKLMTWTLGTGADVPDGQRNLARMYGPQTGSQNYARFRLPAFDALFEKMSSLPDGPERDALFLQAKRIEVAYMPYKVHVHRYINDLAQPWLVGYRRGVFGNNWWQYVDIDESKRPH